MNINEMIIIAIDNQASDVHLTSNHVPLMRVNGALKQLNNIIIEHDEILVLINQLLSLQQREIFKKSLTIDCMHQLENIARLRLHIFQQNVGTSIAIRIIPLVIPDLDKLKLPANLKNLTQYTNGLVLVTGATGCGKSTTLAALLDYINNHDHYHIITIEDPIEYIHSNKKCLINQCEIGNDANDFNSALRSALRADPDIIVIGELRDLETIKLALTAAETGHLVFATLHTNSAISTIRRIIDVFSGSEQEMARTILAASLQAVIAQQLVIDSNNQRVAAVEIMICNAAIRNLIRENKIPQIYSIMETGKIHGMQTLKSVHSL